MFFYGFIKIKVFKGVFLVVGRNYFYDRGKVNGINMYKNVMIVVFINYIMYIYLFFIWE